MIPMPGRRDRTARKQIPAVFRKVQDAFGWHSGTLNLDIGGGPWNLLTEKLQSIGVTNLVYDPFNRTDEHNSAVLEQLKTKPCTTATISNVLCVIKSAESRRKVLEFAKQNTTDVVYITVYEGDKSGIGKATRDGYQLNRRLHQYVQEVAAVFPRMSVYRGMILAFPLDNLFGIR